MSTQTKEVVKLMEILPEQDQDLALELVRKLVLAWDSDYTKATDSERKAMENAINEIKNGDFVSMDEINWD